MWRLATICELVRGNDRMVRSAKVKILARSVGLLYPLEMPRSVGDEGDKETEKDESECVVNRKQRGAAAVAQSKIKQLFQGDVDDV